MAENSKQHPEEIFDEDHAGATLGGSGNFVFITGIEEFMETKNEQPSSS